ncbi:hypothetical protein H6P81_000856 [Aristolochia fimbriata]|uniref:Uncharacterized protein n=1 Tax=Aristolochia fimbriata TaxID=158543 RepID=A0AAV7F9V8_ARIFI|nr:hypothetical protein H6P81_000856 [Aristolochia fimbriata]
MKRAILIRPLDLDEDVVTECFMGTKATRGRTTGTGTVTCEEEVPLNGSDVPCVRPTGHTGIDQGFAVGSFSEDFCPSPESRRMCHMRAPPSPQDHTWHIKNAHVSLSPHVSVPERITTSPLRFHHLYLDSLASPLLSPCCMARGREGERKRSEGAAPPCPCARKMGACG